MKLVLSMLLILTCTSCATTSPYVEGCVDGLYLTYPHTDPDILQRYCLLQEKVRLMVREEAEREGMFDEPTRLNP